MFISSSTIPVESMRPISPECTVVPITPRSATQGHHLAVLVHISRDASYKCFYCLTLLDVLTADVSRASVNVNGVLDSTGDLEVVEAQIHSFRIFNVQIGLRIGANTRENYMLTDTLDRNKNYCTGHKRLDNEYRVPRWKLQQSMSRLGTRYNINYSS